MTNTQLSPELTVVGEFLQPLMPFSSLPSAVFAQLLKHIQIRYYTQSNVLDRHSETSGLNIVRSGAVELRTGDDVLLDRLGEGESFNLEGLTEEQADVKAVFIEDTLVYILPREHYQSMRDSHRPFDRFFKGQRSQRLRRAVRSQDEPTYMTRRIADVMTREVFTTSPEASITDLAQSMSEQRVSCALVLDKTRLVGLITDRDLRSRVLAKGLPGSTTVHEVMTQQPIALPVDTTVFDALLLMTRYGFHHIPVLDQAEVAGIITQSDLTLARQDDPVYLVQHISRQPTVQALQSIARGVDNLLAQWIRAEVPAAQICHILTAISDAITVRLIELAQQEFGPPPVAFCWLAFGSQARGEQLLNADQDNGLLIANELTESQAPWFEKLAHYVCNGLNACGYEYCPGEVMATTAQWRQPLSVWCETVNRWTQRPSNNAVMRVSIFFDLRAVYGDQTLADSLQQHMLKQAQQNTIFQAALAANVLNQTAPLGIFRRFLLERNGEHQSTLDLKKRGVMPIVDIARIYALANGISAVNTLERLQSLVQHKVLNLKDSRNLQDAWRVIMQLRSRAQANQIHAGEIPDNHYNPKDLPKLAQEHLRDAFTVVHDAQSAVKTSFRQGMGS